MSCFLYFGIFSLLNLEDLVDDGGSDSTTIKMDLDPDFILEIDLTLISFSLEAPFSEELIFFDENFFSVSTKDAQETCNIKKFLKDAFLSL